MGLTLYCTPNLPLAMLQFPMPSAIEAQKLMYSLIYLYGARDLALGVAMLGVWYTGHRKALGWVTLAGSSLAIFDGFVSRYQIGRGEWNHWSILPPCVGLAAGLLDWI